MDAAPKHLIIVDGAIMQPIPEHPKRDFIFCLSAAFGDAYLFQVCILFSTSIVPQIDWSSIVKVPRPIYLDYNRYTGTEMSKQSHHLN